MGFNIEYFTGNRVKTPTYSSGEPLLSLPLAHLHTNTEYLFKMKKSEIPWKDSKAMLKEVDVLPKSTPWLHSTLSIPSHMDGDDC